MIDIYMKGRNIDELYIEEEEITIYTSNGEIILKINKQGKLYVAKGKRFLE